MNRAHLMTTACILLSLFAGTAFTAEPVCSPSLLPAPRVELPPMPADGDGVYRISIERPVSPTTLTLWVQMQGGKGVKAAIMSLQVEEGGWWPADASKLTIADGALKGSVRFSVVPPRTRDQYRIMYWKHNRANPDYAPYTGKPIATGKLELKLTCRGHVGHGTYSVTFEGKGKISLATNRYAVPGERYDGRAYLARRPAMEIPDDHQAELLTKYLLCNLPDTPRIGADLFLRIGVANGTVERAAAYAPLRGIQDHALKMVRQELRVSAGGYAGNVVIAHPDAPKMPLTLTVSKTFRIGPRLFGTMTVSRGDFSEFGPCVGVVPGTRDEAFWIDKPGDKQWIWYQDVKPDRELAKRALEESRQPVMPGEPGRTGFWTWRRLVKWPRTVSCIYPPSFDLKEVRGAASYRFDVTQENASHFSLRFEMDKPWRPFTKVWDKIPVSDHAYRVTVTALDGNRKSMGKPVLMGVQDNRDKHLTPGAEVKPAGWIEVPIPKGGIGIHKRPPFHGIVQKTDRSWREAALLLARIRRDQTAIPRARVQSYRHFGKWNPGGDHGFATGWSADVRQHLAYRAETTDPAERLWAESMLQFTVASITAHLDGRPKCPYDYQQNTVLAHYAIEAACDAYVETGNEDFKRQALLAARGVTELQVPNGTFATYFGAGYKYGKPSGRPRDQWFGSIKQLTHYPTYATAELLYSFGRLRRDLETDEFVAAETKAYEWATEHQVRQRFWPLHVCHSHSGYYPTYQHPQAALQFCRYLLECAPEDRRDVELAAQIARWAEDYGVDWTRRNTGEGGLIYPRIEKADRYNNEALVNNVQAAVVFEQLYQATGDRMWRAKGEALAVAAVQAISPDGRVASWSLSAKNTHFRSGKIPHVSFCWGWAAHMLREYAALRQPKTD